MIQPIATESIEIDDLQIQYFDNHVNPGKKNKTLVFIHGVPTSSLLFRKVIPLLSDYRILAPDLPGFGLSEKPDYLDYSLPSLSKYIEKFIKETVDKNERIHLVGHDIGGPISLFFLSRNSKRVRSLMLLNTTLFLEYFRPPAAAVTSFIPIVGGFITGLLTSEFMIETSLRLLLKAPFDNESIMAYTKPYENEDARRALAKVFSSYQDSVPMISALRSYLGDVHLPTTILFGRQDPFCIPENAEELARRIPASKLVFSDQSGHFVSEDDAELIADEIRKLTRHS